MSAHHALTLVDLYGGSGSDSDSGGDDDGDNENAADDLAPLPQYKAAGEAVFDFDGLLQPAPVLRLREDLANGCGGQTWPAGMLLARHVLRHHRHEMETARILELGAGGGLVGLAAALVRSAGPPVLVTDQLPMLELMQHNIALNRLQDRACALVLDWGAPLPAEARALRPTVVLAADCCYFEPAFPLLLQTLDELLALGTPAEPVTVYFCFKKRRRADMQFLRKAQKRFAARALEDPDRPAFSRENLFLYAFCRRS